MKKTLSFFSRLLHKKKDNELKIETPNIQKGIEKTVRISDEFEINVKGLPNNLTEAKQFVLTWLFVDLLCKLLAKIFNGFICQFRINPSFFLLILYPMNCLIIYL